MNILYYPLMYVPKLSDTLKKSRSKCCKIFKVRLVIFGHYAYSYYRVNIFNVMQNVSIDNKRDQKGINPNQTNVLYSNRNQATDLDCKLTNWFLYGCNIIASLGVTTNH